MKTLYLLRHAKAERDAATGEDFDRALAERGRDDAATLGRKLLSDRSLPDTILVSSAKRTLETVEHLTSSWPKPPIVDFDDTLYLASADRLLQAVRKQDDSAESLMVVAHNPGIEELALRLAHNVPSEALRRLQKKVPTCALATFAISVDRWSRTDPDLARLVAFLVPKNPASN